MNDSQPVPHDPDTVTITLSYSEAYDAADYFRAGRRIVPQWLAEALTPRDLDRLDSRIDHGGYPGQWEDEWLRERITRHGYVQPDGATDVERMVDDYYSGRLREHPDDESPIEQWPNLTADDMALLRSRTLTRWKAMVARIENDEARRRALRSSACPACGAPSGAPCRTANGKRVGWDQAHSDRRHAAGVTT